MEIIKVENRTEELVASLTALWEESVTATHNFLTTEGIAEIKKYVPQAIGGVKHLVVAVENKKPLGFIGVENNRIEMLFLLPENTGGGIGKTLVNRVIADFNVCEVMVNEQNPAAVGFYEHIGFQTYKRTDMDEAGMPYPLLYMKLK